MLKIKLMPPSTIFNLMMYVTTPFLNLNNNKNDMLYRITIYTTTTT